MGCACFKGNNTLFISYLFFNIIMSRGLVWENITQNINPKKLSTSDYNYNTKSGSLFFVTILVQFIKNDLYFDKYPIVQCSQ